MNEPSATSPRRSRGPLAGADDRLLRGYGPLVGLAVLFLVATILAPTVAPEQLVGTGGAQPGTPGAAPDARTPGQDSAPGAGDGSGGPAETPSPIAPDGPAETPSPIAPGIPAAAACPGYQVDADPYSPPCAKWPGGDNGGATAPGVDATTITLTLRDIGAPDPGSLIAQFSGNSDYVSTQAELLHTAETLVDYFNSRYEFYGRQIELVQFKGQGDALGEVLGGGRSGAQADAIKASQEVRAFANMFAVTHPFSDALAANGVIAFDNIFMTREWANQRPGFSWNVYPTIDNWADATTAFAVRQLVGKPASFAGSTLQETPRKFGIVYPDMTMFEPSARRLRDALRDAGAEVRMVGYVPDIGTMQNQAQQMASTLADDGVTTVLVLTDPAMPFFLSSSAQGIRWTPEWVLTGQPFLDLDYAAQIFPGEQWAHAFGISYIGEALAPRNTDAYRAFKAQSPDTEPGILLLSLVYQELRLLAIGVQMAGPNLTPATFTQGLRAYQSSFGPDGTWAFPEGDYVAPQDFKIVWFDGTATSPTNDQPGAYLDNGQRYTVDSLPAGDPAVFPNGPA